MKLKKIILENVKSFKDRTEINFRGDLNIFIGPNAGGKSNLFEIIQGIFNDIVFENINIQKENHPDRPPYKVQKVPKDLSFAQREILDKSYRHEHKRQKIILELLIESEDVKIANSLYRHRNQLINFEQQQTDSTLINESLSTIVFSNFENLIGKKLEIKIVDGSLNPPQNVSNEPYREFFKFLKNINIFANFINLYNSSFVDKKIEFHPLLIYFSPYRPLLTLENKVMVNLSQFQSPIFYYQHNLSQKAQLNIWSIVVQKLVENRFLGREEENTHLKNYLKENFGITYKMTCKRKLDNFFEVIFSRNRGWKSPKLSSGEAELLNFLSIFFISHIRNGIILIDEPELHLHPKWQQLLLGKIRDFANEFNLQFFLVTHSPHFITPESIGSTYRVYSTKRWSKVADPQKLDEREGELFRMVNIFNNAKVFFADKVILVEGDDDLIIYSAVLQRIQQRQKSSEVIEIIPVQQKGGFKKNKEFLEKWKIKVFAIVDKEEDKKELQGKKWAFILKNGKLEDYFRNIRSVKRKSGYKIEDALIVAERIEKEGLKAIHKKFRGELIKIFTTILGN